MVQNGRRTGICRPASGCVYRLWQEGHFYRNGHSTAYPAYTRMSISPLSWHWRCLVSLPVRACRDIIVQTIGSTIYKELGACSAVILEMYRSCTLLSFG